MGEIPRDGREEVMTVDQNRHERAALSDRETPPSDTGETLFSARVNLKQPRQPRIEQKNGVQSSEQRNGAYVS